jgi:hypothetical protein
MKWTPPHDSVGIMCQSRPWRSKEEEPMEKKDSVVAVDIAKDVFDAAVSHEPGRVSERRRLSRKVFLLFLRSCQRRRW